MGTQYRVYDKNGDLRKIIDKKHEKKLEQNEWLKGVTCFILNDKAEVLVEKRANTELTPGQLDLCSGHLDNDETPTQAMIRELREELGIELEEAINVMKITPKEIPFEFNNNERTLRFLINVFCLKSKNIEIKQQEEEVANVCWVPLEECFELIRTGQTKFPSDYDYEEIFQKVREICNNDKGSQNKENNR